MFPPGARDARTRCGRRRRSETTPNPVARLVEADPAKALVMRYLRRLVADGHAEWDWHESGDIWLRLQTGETFRLADKMIIRIA
jgi:hypothetical protein